MNQFVDQIEKLVQGEGQQTSRSPVHLTQPTLQNNHNQHSTDFSIEVRSKYGQQDSDQQPSNRSKPGAYLPSDHY